MLDLRPRHSSVDLEMGAPGQPAVSSSSPAVWLDESGAWRTTLRGHAVLADPRINKGTAFSLEERDALGLVGILPHRVLALEDQVRRAYAQYRSQATQLAKHLVLGELRERNQVLFYR
jgi:malate dehydrogenase (oxaloacetate-decarboxylating)